MMMIRTMNDDEVSSSLVGPSCAVEEERSISLLHLCVQRRGRVRNRLRKSLI